jgi:hypothetical protein
VHTIQTEIPKPENEADFEQLCVTVYGHVHGDDLAQLNGRKGQKQYGVDVFVNPRSGGRIGVQSKRYKDGLLTINDVRAEVKKADDGGVLIDKLVVATTAVNEAVLLRQVQELSDQRQKAGLFTVHIDFWSDICSHIRRHAFLQDQYAPTTPGAAYHRQELGMAKLNADVQVLLAQVQNLQGHQAETALPASRDDSANRVIANQLDSINELLKSAKYRDAHDRLEVIAKDFPAMDTHQKARWHVQQGVCLVHLHDGAGAADAFLTAGELYPADEKMIAAKVRGLMLRDPAAGAKAGEAAVKDFPGSKHVWLAMVHAKSAAGLDVAVADVPAPMAEDAEVLQFLCWQALEKKESAAAANFARRLLTLPETTVAARSTALTAAMALTISDQVALFCDSVPPETIQLVENATQAFEPRAEKLWRNQSPSILSNDVVNLTYAYLVLSRPEIASKILDESELHIELDPRLIAARLDTLKALDRTDECLVLAKANLNILHPEARRIVAEVAANAGAVDVITELAELPNSPIEEKEEMRALRWIALHRSGAEAEAAREAAAMDPDTVHAPMVLLLAARVLLASGNRDAGLRYLERARVLVVKDSRDVLKLQLADVMIYAKHYGDGARLLAPFAKQGFHTEVHKKLLHAYIRSGQRRRAKALLDSLPPNWSADDRTREMAIELANSAADWHNLRHLAVVELEREPRQASAWMLRLAAEVRTATGPQFSAMLSTIPEELDGTTKHIVQLASLEMRYGEHAKGMMRLYRYLRRNPDDADAAAGFMIAIVGFSRELPWMDAELPVVRSGASVVLEGNNGNRVELAIDPEEAGELPPAKDFLSPSHEIAQVLNGKVLGEEVELELAMGFRRRFKIVTVTTAFRRLLAKVQERAHSPINGLPNIFSVEMVKEDGQLDMVEMHAMLTRSRESAEFIFEQYRTQELLTLEMCASALRVSPVELIFGWPSEGPPMLVSRGGQEERAKEVEALVEENVSAVLDLATLAEVIFTESEGTLATLQKVVVTQHTQQQLRELCVNAAEDASIAHAIDVDGQMQIHEIGEVQKRWKNEQLARMQAVIDQHCEVLPVYGAEDVSESFTKIEGLIGDDGYQALLLAHERKAVLLSVDVRLREIAQALLGIPGISLQTLWLVARARNGFSQAAFAHSVARQYLNNRNHLYVDGYDLAWMCWQGDLVLQAALQRFWGDVASGRCEFASSALVVKQFLKELVAGANPKMDVALTLNEYMHEALFRHPQCPKEYLLLARLNVSSLVRRSAPVTGIRSIDTPVQQRRNWIRSALLESVDAAYQCSQQPTENRIPALTVVKGTTRPTIILQPLPPKMPAVV